MANKFITNNPILRPFFDELNKYSEGVHNLNEGASPSLIENLESTLGIKLPKNYKEFLQICNGGELFAAPAGTVISEIYDASKDTKKIGCSYLNEAFKPERR